MNTKICTKCEIEKELSEFYFDKRTLDGHTCWCKSCDNKKMKNHYKRNKKEYQKRHKINYLKTKKETNKRHKKYYKENKEQHINYRLKKYGITLDQYNQMLEEQNGGCAICGNLETAIDYINHKPRRLAVDHNHKTGKVRGLLCGKCNKAIGLVDEDIIILKTIIKYLKSYE